MLTVKSIVTGRLHNMERKGCEDHVSEHRLGHIRCMCLCDGAGSYKHVAVGARVMSRKMAEWLCCYFRDFMILPNDEIIIAYAAAEMKIILKELRELTGVTEDPTAFASTMLCAAMDERSGKYIIITLGDGMAAVDHGDGFAMITEPHDSFNRATYLTVSPIEDLWDNIKVVRGVCKSMALCSDGAEGFLYERDCDKITRFLPTLAKAASEGDPRNIGDEIACCVENSFRPFDDFSLAMLIRGVHPTPEKLGYQLGQDRQKRRIMKAFNLFSRAREAGLSISLASRQAGWGHKAIPRKLKTARELKIL